MKVARGALLSPTLPLGEGRGEGNGHGEQRLSFSGVALVAMAVSRELRWLRHAGLPRLKPLPYMVRPALQE